MAAGKSRKELWASITHLLALLWSVCTVFDCGSSQFGFNTVEIHSRLMSAVKPSFCEGCLEILDCFPRNKPLLVCSGSIRFQAKQWTINDDLK